MKVALRTRAGFVKFKNYNWDRNVYKPIISTLEAPEIDYSKKNTSDVLEAVSRDFYFKRIYLDEHDEEVFLYAEN